ncbi:MAG: fused MFS/spermidine synthase [Nitrospirales bacterium]
MAQNQKLIFLFFIIFLEGYVVLSAELLAIRQTLPFVGSGTDTVSIIIAAVLMPLAFGYYAGGQHRGRIRNKLIRNLLMAGAVLTIGLSYVALTWFFSALTEGLEWKNRLLLITLYALLFLVTPVYLLGQTVPLISNYFRRAHLPRIAGRILFYSTIGSFLGAVFTTLVLMNTIGVAETAAVTVAAIVILIVLLSKPRMGRTTIAAVFLLLFVVALNSPSALETVGVISNNTYNTVEMEDYDNTLYFRLNRSYASAIYPDHLEDPVFEYIRYIQHHYIRHFKQTEMKGKILVLGAGGFTIGLGDTWNEYVFVDIDPELKELAETQFLKRKLDKNKTFVAVPARGYLNQTKETFDLIIVDVFHGLHDAPEHLVTKEFFMQVKNKLTPRGVVIVNHFGSPLGEDTYARGIDNTIRTVFPHANRIPLYDFNPWRVAQSDDKNILYIARNLASGGKEHVYTDNVNRAAFDKNQDVPY